MECTLQGCVIPAQAGIQQRKASREADKTAMLPRCAGMTG